MGAPVSDIQPGEQPSAEALLGSFSGIAATELRKHASVLNYWLSLRGDRDFPTIRDLDALELSDASPGSILLELIGGGEDAEIRHVGEALKSAVNATRVADAPRPSLLASIAGKLAIVAISRNALPFQDEFTSADGPTRCWITLLPFSSTGAWVDYVYGFVTWETAAATADPAPESDAEQTPATAAEPVADAEVDPVAESPAAEVAAAPVDEIAEPAADEVGEPAEPETATDMPEAAVEQPAIEPAPAPAASVSLPGFSPKVTVAVPDMESGFYGAGISAEPKLPAVSAKSKTTKTASVSEGSLENRLKEVRSKADEARLAKLRANAALYDGLSAAYDFALDAEEKPEEYLRLVEAQGLKIQLRSPMTPVVRLAFGELCDDSTIAQLETILAWALKQDLPRGTLVERIEAEGGIAPILNGQAKAA